MRRRHDHEDNLAGGDQVDQVDHLELACREQLGDLILAVGPTALLDGPPDQGVDIRAAYAVSARLGGKRARQTKLAQPDEADVHRADDSGGAVPLASATISRAASVVSVASSRLESDRYLDTRAEPSERVYRLRTVKARLHRLRLEAVARIALVNHPSFSHIEAMSRLTRVLVGQGHDVIVWAPKRCRTQIEDGGARFEPHAPDLSRGKGDVLAARLASTTERFAEQLIEQFQAYDVELVVRDSTTPWALVAGEYLGIPRIVSHPMFPIVARDDAATSDGESVRASSDSEEEEEAAAAPAAARERFESTWLSIASRWGVELDDLSGIFHNTSEPTMTFTTEVIVGDHQLRPSWRCIGPLLSPPPPAAPKSGRPLVYACFGTTYNPRPGLFRTVIDSLGEEPCDVLVSTGGGIVSATDLRPLPPNVELRKFVPAREVLARASAHITHGGCNSVHESLLAAVPMACLPQWSTSSPSPDGLKNWEPG